MRKIVFAPIWALPRMRLDGGMAGIVFRSCGATAVPTPAGSMPYPVEAVNRMAEVMQFFLDDIREPGMDGAMSGSEGRERFGAAIESFTGIDTDGANPHMLGMLRSVS